MTIAPTDENDPAGTRDATIADGTRNGISTSAIGATASFTMNAAGDTDFATDSTVGGGVEISASNAAPVTNSGTMEDSSILAGYQNSISRTAVGASASLSSTMTAVDGASFDNHFTIEKDISISSNNEESVQLRTDINGAHIESGSDNSISGSAIGASSSLSLQESVAGGGTGNTTYTLAHDGTIALTATNSGDVSIASASDEDAPATISDVTFGTDSVRGSVSLNAIGASATITVATYLYDSEGSITLDLGNYTMSAVNTGAVTANVSAQDLTLSEGTSSISFGAIGSTIGMTTKIYSSSDVSAPSKTSLPASQWSTVNEGTISMTSSFESVSISSGMGRSIGATAGGSAASFSPQF